MKLWRKIFPSWADLKGDLLLQVFLAYLIISQVYYSYRYFLGYGSTSTSPHAQDTPLEFQLPRYLITLAFYLIVLGIILWRRSYFSNILEKVKGSRKILLLTLAFFAYLALGMLKFDFDLFNFSFREMTKLVFFAPVALVPLALFAKERLTETLFKFMNLALIFQVVGFAAVFATFLISGKLPAQAYPGSMIRFGGLWDDPNGFAFFLLIPLFAYLSLPAEIQARYKKWIYLATLAISVMLFLTLSLTAWLIMVIGLVVLLIFRRSKFILTNLAIIAVTFLVLSLISPYTKDFLAFKTASFMARIYATLGIPYQLGGGPAGPGQEGYISDSEILAALGGQLIAAFQAFDKAEILDKLSIVLFGKRGVPIFSENIYLLLFFNFGLVGMGVFLTLLFYGIHRAWQLATQNKAPFFGLFSLAVLIAAAIGLSSLPYLVIYPVAVYLWLILLLLWL